MLRIPGALTRGLVGLAALQCSTLALSTAAGASELVWRTKLQLTVVQWLPIEGEFRELEALGGEFEVAANGSVSLPVLGAIDVADLAPETLAQEVATQLQGKLGLLQTPAVRVQVVGQPPIYVVGMVESPGENVFRPGLTALQALALGGGPVRDSEQAPEDRIALLSRQRLLDADIRSVQARLARLEAEASGVDAIEFPDELDTAQNASLLSQEQKIFDIRVHGLERQRAALAELRELYKAESEVLASRVINLEERIAAAEADRERIVTLLSRGLATVSQRTELEMFLGDLRSDRLDHLTAQMRVQQLLSQANRDLVAIEDERQSDIANGLLAERATLARLATERLTVVRLLEELDRRLLTASTAGAPTQVRYTIIRGGEEQAATEMSLLEPGDVVKVSLETGAPSTDLAALE